MEKCVCVCVKGGGRFTVSAQTIYTLFWLALGKETTGKKEGWWMHNDNTRWIGLHIEEEETGRNG